MTVGARRKTLENGDARGSVSKEEVNQSPEQPPHEKAKGGRSSPLKS